MALPAARTTPTTPLSLAELTTMVKEIVADDRFWRPRLPSLAGDPACPWTRLWADSAVDVWLRRWPAGSATDLHDHGPSATAFSVVLGTLAETWPDHAQGHVRRHEVGDTVWVAPGVRHALSGMGSSYAVSIHASSPPQLDVSGRVNAVPAGCLVGVG